MRKLTCFLLAGCAAVGATDTWRWVDANGVVHFSDRPVPGAERLVLKSAPKPGSVVPPTPPRRPQAPATRPRNYSSCRITSPTSDQVFNAVTQVAASIELQPALQDGHRIRVNLNGRTVTNWPDSALSYMLTDINRGSWSLAVEILDESGRAVCSAPAITFHVRQPSMLSPLSPQQPGGSPRGVPGVPGVPSVPRAGTAR